MWENTSPPMSMSTAAGVSNSESASHKCWYLRRTADGKGEPDTEEVIRCKITNSSQEKLESVVWCGMKVKWWNPLPETLGQRARPTTLLWHFRRARPSRWSAFKSDSGYLRTTIKEHAGVLIVTRLFTYANDRCLQ